MQGCDFTQYQVSCSQLDNPRKKLSKIKKILLEPVVTNQKCNFRFNLFGVKFKTELFGLSKIYSVGRNCIICPTTDLFVA